MPERNQAEITKETKRMFLDLSVQKTSSVATAHMNLKSRQNQLMNISRKLQRHAARQDRNKLNRSVSELREQTMKLERRARNSSARSVRDDTENFNRTKREMSRATSKEIMSRSDFHVKVEL